MADPRQPWDRQKGEGAHLYAAFSLYLSLGAGRTIHQAVRKYLADPRPGDDWRTRQQERLRRHERPAVYRRSVYTRWKLWSARWKWVERAAVYDEHIEYVARKAEIEADVARRKADAEAWAAEREALGEDAVELLHIVRLLRQRIREVLQDPRQLAQLALERTKEVVTHTVGDDMEAKVTVERPGLLELLGLTEKGSEVGARLWRLADLDRGGEDGEEKPAEQQAQQIGTMLAETILEKVNGQGDLEALREALVELNGKPERSPG